MNTKENLRDVHAQYNKYLLGRQHSMHFYMGTVHAIYISENENKGIIIPRGCAEVPPKLQKHIKWFLKKFYKITSVEYYSDR